MIEAHGGRIINRIVPPEDREEFLVDLQNMRKYYISQGDLSVFHRIADGTLSPLEGPMTGEAFYKVLDEEHIEKMGRGLRGLFPLPSQ
jgi:sulfate adenylyltransferase